MTACDKSRFCHDCTCSETCATLLPLRRADEYHFAGKVEIALQNNPQYAYARALGQLDPLRVVPVESPLQRYQQWALEQRTAHW